MVLCGVFLNPEVLNVVAGLDREILFPGVWTLENKIIMR